MSTHVVIMAGGVGSRLWPISTPSTPKQFIDVLGVGRSMIQLTVERFRPVCKDENFWVVTGERYVSMTREQLPFMKDDHILAEPAARNTAPCIAYACRKIALKDPDATVVVTPADALVLNTGTFTNAISKAIESAEGSSRIVTVGIRPTRPETGYGYICSESVEEGKVVKVRQFKEKPTLSVAKEYLDAGNYFWNAGIFVWAVKTVNDALRRYAPSISEVMDRIEPSMYTEKEREVLKEHFPSCEKISIDYAVMEKSPDIYVISGDMGWSDLGTWGSVKGHIEADDNGNSVVGEDVRLHGCSGCVVHAADAKRVVVEGLSDYIVSLKDGNLLVCSLADEQSIREYSQD